MITIKKLIGSLLVLTVLFTSIFSVAFADVVSRDDNDKASSGETIVIEKDDDDKEDDEPEEYESGDVEEEDEPEDDESGDVEEEDEPEDDESGDVEEDDESGDVEPGNPVTDVSGDDEEETSGDVEDETSGDEEETSGEAEEDTSGDEEKTSGEAEEATSGDDEDNSGEKEEYKDYGTGSYGYVIDLKNSKGGKITPHKGSVTKGKSQTYEFVPDAGYVIKDVLVDGKSQGAIEKYTLENVKERHSIEVVFEQSGASDWATDAINKAKKYGLLPESFAKITSGKTITREQSAEIVVKLYEKLANKEVNFTIENPFKDTENEAVLKAYAVGITLGTSENTFSPEKLITREQLVTMLGRAIVAAGFDAKLDLEKLDLFLDDPEIHEWAKELVYFLQGKEIVKGIGENLFDPRSNSTMEQAIVLVVRCYEAFAK